jgi:hypothetical protein
VLGSAGFQALAEGLAKKDPRIENDFREWQAVYALRDSGLAPDLPWPHLRRGCPEQEPDFVLGPPSGQILAGIEITQLPNKSARARNVELSKLQRSRQRTARRNKRSRNVTALNDAARAFAEAGGAGSEYQRFQKFLQVYNEEQLEQAIAERIEDKKTKPYHKKAPYPVHLVLHLLDCICEGDARQATRRAEPDPGRFAAIWCVHPVLGVWQI